MLHFANFGQALNFACCTGSEFSCVVGADAYWWSNNLLSFVPYGHAVKIDLSVMRRYAASTARSVYNEAVRDIVKNAKEII